jgi:transcriptional regulator with XRE-family HTH domain
VVRLVRLRAGLSIAELADHSAISVPTVRSIESGAAQPTVRTLGRLVVGAGGARLRLGVEWPGEPVRVLSDRDSVELGRWAAVTAGRSGRPPGRTPERLLAYLGGRPGATAAQAAYAFGEPEAVIRAMALLLPAAGDPDWAAFWGSEAIRPGVHPPSGAPS